MKGGSESLWGAQGPFTMKQIQTNEFIAPSQTILEYTGYRSFGELVR